MWPFGGVPETMAGPTRVDLLATVASGNEVTSPLSGSRAAFVHVEVLERMPRSAGVIDEGDAFTTLGQVIFGDLAMLGIEQHGIMIDVVVRRAVLSFVNMRAAPRPMHTVVAELSPFLARAHGGVICQREHLVRRGDRLRLRAVVERGGVGRLVVRDDLGPVYLDEVLEDPRF